MNLLSIAASLGVIVAVFQFGWFPGVSSGPIEAFLPVLMFAIVFGLSMDYEVFLVSRIHEEWTFARRATWTRHDPGDGLVRNGESDRHWLPRQSWWSSSRPSSSAARG